MGSDITVRAGEVRRRLSPRTRIGASSSDIRRDGAPRKLPDANPSRAELQGHDAATVTVEGRAERGRASIDAAAGVVVRRVDAGGGEGLAGLLPLDAHAAPGRRVQRHLVRGAADHVDGLHDVDLAVRGPVAGVAQPQRRPGAAAKGRVEDVEDEEPVGVLLLAGDAHGEAAGRGVGVAVGRHGGVDAQHGRGSAGEGEVQGLSLRGGNVVHESLRGVVAREVVEVVKE